SGERLSVQKIAAGLSPLTVGEAKIVSAFGAAVPVPCWRTKGFQLIGSVPETGMPYTFHVKGTAKEFELCTFQTRATAGASGHCFVRTSGMTGVGVGVGVRDGVRVAVGVFVFVGGGVGVFEGDGVFVLVGVGVLVGVFVGAARSDAAPIQMARAAGSAKRTKRETGPPVVMRTSLPREMMHADRWWSRRPPTGCAGNVSLGFPRG